MKNNKQENRHAWIAFFCVMAFLLSAALTAFGQSTAPNVSVGTSTICIVFDQQGDERYADAILNIEKCSLTITLSAKGKTDMQIEFEDVIIEWADDSTVTAYTGKDMYLDFFEIHTDTGAAYWRVAGRTSGFIQKLKADR